MYASSFRHDENSNPKGDRNNTFRNNDTTTTTAATATTAAVVAVVSVPSLPPGQLIEQGSEIDVLSGEINFEKMYYKLLLDTYPSDQEIKQMDVQQQHMNSSSSSNDDGIISSGRRSVADAGLVDFIASLKVSHDTEYMNRSCNFI
jgi:hypothetical protein